MYKVNTYYYGNTESDNILIQMVDDHDMAVIEKEIEYIHSILDEKPSIVTSAEMLTLH